MVRNYVLFFAIMIAIFAIAGVCSYKGLFDTTASSETQRWAQTTLSALFTGCVSFVLGQLTVKRAK